MSHTGPQDILPPHFFYENSLTGELSSDPDLIFARPTIPNRPSFLFSFRVDTLLLNSISLDNATLEGSVRFWLGEYGRWAAFTLSSRPRAFHPQG